MPHVFAMVALDMLGWQQQQHKVLLHTPRSISETEEYISGFGVLEIRPRPNASPALFVPANIHTIDCNIQGKI